MTRRRRIAYTLIYVWQKVKTNKQQQQQQQQSKQTKRKQTKQTTKQITNKQLLQKNKNKNKNQTLISNLYGFTQRANTGKINDCSCSLHFLGEVVRHNFWLSKIGTVKKKTINRNDF